MIYRFIAVLAFATLSLPAADEASTQLARDNFFRLFPGSEISKVKEESHDSANFISLWTMDAGRPSRTYKVEGRDPHNKSIEAEFDRKGELVKLDAIKVPLDRVPAAVLKTAEDAHDKVKWYPMAECEKFQNSALYYTLRGKHGDKKLNVRITASGQLIPKSK
jgi:hypothetical protein